MDNLTEKQKEKHRKFQSELRALLAKYKAEIEGVNDNYYGGCYIEIDYDFDEECGYFFAPLRL